MKQMKVKLSNIGKQNTDIKTLLCNRLLCFANLKTVLSFENINIKSLIFNSSLGVVCPNFRTVQISCLNWNLEFAWPNQYLILAQCYQQWTKLIIEGLLLCGTCEVG